VLPVTWFLRLRQPAPPPASAGVAAQRQYWHNRLQENVADVDAYVRLGVLEERAGFYMSAVKYLRAARALGASDSAVSGPLGRALTQLARDDEALPELEKAVKIAPASVEATFNLAGLYINQSAPAMAADVLKRFVETHQPIQKAADAERLALGFLESRNSRLARKMAERALELAPQNMVARSVVVRTAMAEKDYPAAQRHLESMLAQVPEDAAVLYLYGLVLEARGDDKRALEQWQKTVAYNPDAVDAYEKIGNVYARKGDMRRAAIAYERVAQRLPSQESAVRVAGALSTIKNPTPVEKGRTAYWSAVAAGFTGNYSAALRLGQIAAKNSATRRPGLEAVAEAYRGMQKKQPFLDVMQQITAGGSVDDLLVMARAWGQADEHAKNSEYLKRALAKAPAERQAAIHGELAETYRKRGMRDEAEHELEEALQKEPRNPQFHRQLAELYFARRTVGDRLKRAISAWESAIALDPSQDTDWEQLGRAYLAAGQPGKAVRFLEHAVDLEPGYGPTYLELSRTYASLGDKTSSKYALGLYSKFVAYDQQRQTLRTRARREKASAEDLIAYGDFLRRTGYANDAVRQYEMAVSLRPKDGNLRAKLAALYTRLGMSDRQAQLMVPRAEQTGGG
jgi:tetratricopeptide (TPR) repeat protein